MTPENADKRILAKFAGTRSAGRRHRFNESRLACSVGLAPAASARRFYPDPLSRTEPNAGLTGYFLFAAVVANDNGAPGGAVCPARQAVWAARAPVGEQRDLSIGQDLNFTNDPVAASVHATATASRTKRISPQPH